jgi:hypothetical protein
MNIINIRQDELIDNGYTGKFPKRGHSIRDQGDTIAIYRKRGAKWFNTLKTLNNAFNEGRHSKVVIYNICEG